jgi:hypothetical protein
MESLAKQFPTVPQYRYDLARFQDGVGNVLRDTGKLKEAEAAYRRALNIEEKLAAEFPAIVVYPTQLISCYLHESGLRDSKDSETC